MPDTTWIVDGRRPVKEIETRESGDTTEHLYTWGLDLAGWRDRRSLDESGGIGGLLAVRERVNGRDWATYYVLSDPMGNVMAPATARHSSTSMSLRERQCQQRRPAAYGEGEYDAESVETKQCNATDINHHERGEQRSGLPSSASQEHVDKQVYPAERRHRRDQGS